MYEQTMGKNLHGGSSINKNPLFSSSVLAGFPSPADDYIEGTLDLNEYLIGHPTATYFLRAFGDSMIDSGIYHGDILIVDRALKPVNNKIVVVAVDGELMVKRFRRNGDKILLMPDNPQYKPIEVTEEMNVEIWGTVTAVIHKV